LKSSSNKERDPNKVIITKLGLWIYSVMVFILFFCLSQPIFSPESIISIAVQSLDAKMIVMIIALPVVVLEIILRKKGLRTYYIKNT